MGTHKSDQVLAHEAQFKKRATSPGRHILADAENRLRTLHVKIDNVRWRLDSARSLLRKAQPETGYRSNPTLGDKSWDTKSAEQAVFAAEVALLQLCEEVCPDPAVQRNG